MRAALAFLTPLGGHRTPDAGTMTWFPVVGALLGLVLGGAWWGAARLWPPLVAAALVVTADLALTGMLHLDGVVDAADGLLPHLPRERRLAVMSEPTVGAFGVVVAVAVLVLRVAALAAMAPLVPLVVALWCASRTLMAVAARTVPYARAEGLASAFGGGSWWPPALVGAVGTGAAVAVAVARAGHPGPAVALVVGAAAGVGVVVLGRRRVGGYTGDVLGAAGVVAETVGLVVAAARW